MSLKEQGISIVLDDDEAARSRRTYEIVDVIKKNIRFHLLFDPEIRNLLASFGRRSVVILSTLFLWKASLAYREKFGGGMPGKGRGSQSSETLSENP